MIGGGFCKLTCGKCDDGGQQRVTLHKANSPVTLEKASVDNSASASVQTDANAKVCMGNASGDCALSSLLWQAELLIGQLRQKPR